MAQIVQLSLQDLDEIMQVEARAFIPLIQASREKVQERLQKEHIYLGVQVNTQLAGTFALRPAHFVPDIQKFLERYPTFREYAELSDSEEENALFGYSLGILKQHRNFFNAKSLLESAINLAKHLGKQFIVGDSRIPGYNGSCEFPDFEKFDKNPELHEAIDRYFATEQLPSRDLLMQDPVLGTYLRINPKGKILGITPPRFWQPDNPCNGQMVIIYLDLQKEK